MTLHRTTRRSFLDIDGLERSANLSIHSSSDNYRRVVTVEGELDADSAPSLRSFIADLSKAPSAATTFDLTGISFCAAAGVTELLRITRFPSAHIRISDSVARVLHIVNLSSFLSEGEEFTTLNESPDPDAIRISSPEPTGPRRRSKPVKVRREA